MTTQIMSLVSQLLLIVVPAILTYWLGKKKTQDKQIEAVILANQLHLRYMLTKLHDKYMEQQVITREEFNEFMTYNDCYTALGGNHVNIEYKKDLQGLEIKE